MTVEEIRTWLIASVARAAHLDPAAIDLHESFDAYGMSSTDAVALSGDLEQLLGRELSPTLIYEYPSIEALSRFLGGETVDALPTAGAARPAPTVHEPIAIIGIGCRFPGADDLAAFWRLLREGRDMIREVPADRWDADRWFNADQAVPGKSVTRWGGFLEQVDGFDPFFFGISPGEAERMDPQQRLLMELAYEAFEDAGYPIPALAGSQTAVFVGISANEYAMLQAGRYDHLNGHSAAGVALSIAANRISYFFDLHGASIAVDTACSSSLTAIHLACKALSSGECGLALAGGVNLILSPVHSIAFTKAGVLAPDGRCKPFDASANGYVRGEGGGMVVLKPLARALADGDPIYAVIRGGAVQQDGRTNGLMAPNPDAQEALLRSAYLDAGVPPQRIGYVEAHGTGTLLGDSMEARALGAVLSPGRTTGPCAVGSVKSNFGHLEAAAGVAGLIKTALSLTHRVIPASLHFATPNPHVPFESLKLKVPQSLAPWPHHNGPALAGVSSFGFGGTNVHLVLEEAPTAVRADRAHDARPDLDTPQLIPLSARSTEALHEVAQRFRDFVVARQADPLVRLRDICLSAGVRRNHLDHRLIILARSKSELVERLDAFVRGAEHPDVQVSAGAVPDNCKSAFVFSGQGSQWPGMGRELMQQEPVFKVMLEHCDAALLPYLGSSLFDLLGDDAKLARLEEIDLIQPTLFAIQVALAALWRSWGVEPDAVVGHSMGEVAAAHVAGALSLQDAALVIGTRSRLLKRLSGSGGMALVGLSIESVAPRLSENGRRLAVAASNGPRSTVVAGDRDELAALLATLEEEGVFSRLVDVDIAAHGTQAAALGVELRQSLATIEPRPARVPFFSTVSGTAVGNRLLDAEYWTQNLSEPVNFTGAVKELLRSGHQVFVEISPHPVLQAPIQQSIIHYASEGTALASLRRGESESRACRESLALYYLAGGSIDWRSLDGGDGRFIHLPAYPWQRERFWIDAATENGGAPHLAKVSSRPGANPLLGEHVTLAHQPGAHLWQGSLDPRIEAMLQDHKVNGEVVVPAAIYLEMALSAADEAGLAGSHVFSDMAFSRVLLLRSEEPPVLQVSVEPAGDDAFSLAIFSSIAKTGTPEWTRHATARLVPVDAGATLGGEASMGLNAIKERCREPVESDLLYRALADRGLDYGPAMRGVATAWRRDGEALGFLVVPASSPADANHFRLHPVLLDAALQLLAAAAPATTPGDTTTTLVPVACRSVRLLGAAGPELWGHVELKGFTDAGSGEIDADIRLFDPTGILVAELAGLRLAPVTRPQPAGAQAEQDIWRYEVRWQLAPWPDRAVAEPERKEGGERWIIVADRGGLASALERQFAKRGASCRVIDPGDDAQLADALRVERKSVRAVVHLAALGLGPDAITGAAADPTLGCHTALALVQSLVTQSSVLGNPRLYVVTQGAQPVIPDQPLSVAQAPIWGLGKSIAFELPQFRCTLVDLDPAVEPARASELLLRELLANDEEDQVGLRGEKRFAARLVPTAWLADGPACAIAGGTVLPADATYLITGGLGGLGLAVAGWLIERGAKHLALVGRTPATGASRQAATQLAATGAQVLYVTADVSRPDELAGALDHVRASMPPLRGVIHAAGLLDNAPVMTLDADRLARVMAPKVAGAWNLHLATRDDALDFFALFSSAVSVLGSPGQGNYSAANSFLDALAHHRHREQRPGVSVNWGPWAEIGLVAAGNSIGTRRSSASGGVKGIAPRRGLEVLAMALREESAQFAVLPFDLRSLLELYPAAARLPLFSESGGAETHVARLYARPRLRQEYIAPRDDIESRLAELWRHTLRIDRVGIRDSFFELGGDSVLAAQVLAALHRVFGVTIDPRDAFQLFTIENLARRIEAALIAKMDAMCEEEVENLLHE
ncbi:MAG: SDR family NAD(P)-dependent oxidoreductase [Gemmatimonadales bacterium]